METRYIEDEHGKPTDTLLLYSVEAKEEDVEKVINAPANLDGRSEWRWFRLQNGTLILGLYPQGNTYLEVSDNLEI